MPADRLRWQRLVLRVNDSETAVPEGDDKLSCFDVSEQYIATGSSVGNVLLFDKLTRERVASFAWRDCVPPQLVTPNAAPSFIHISVSPDEDRVALVADIASSPVVLVARIPSDDQSDQHLSCSHHTLHGAAVTALSWLGSKVVSADAGGYVVVMNPSNGKADVAIREDCAVVQISKCDADSMVISTLRRAAFVRLPEGAPPTAIGIGTQPRQGLYGACYAHGAVYAVRPKKEVDVRLWRADPISGKVVSTLKFTGPLSPEPPTTTAVDAVEVSGTTCSLDGLYRKTGVHGGMSKFKRSDNATLYSSSGMWVATDSSKKKVLLRSDAHNGREPCEMKRWYEATGDGAEAQLAVNPDIVVQEPHRASLLDGSRSSDRGDPDCPTVTFIDEILADQPLLVGWGEDGVLVLHCGQVKIPHGCVLRGVQRVIPSVVGGAPVLYALHRGIVRDQTLFLSMCFVPGVGLIDRDFTPSPLPSPRFFPTSCESPREVVPPLPPPSPIPTSPLLRSASPQPPSAPFVPVESSPPPESPTPSPEPALSPTPNDHDEASREDSAADLESPRYPDTLSASTNGTVKKQGVKRVVKVVKVVRQSKRGDDLSASKRGVATESADAEEVLERSTRRKGSTRKAYIHDKVGDNKSGGPLPDSVDFKQFLPEIPTDLPPPPRAELNLKDRSTPTDPTPPPEDLAKDESLDSTVEIRDTNANPAAAADSAPSGPEPAPAAADPTPAVAEPVPAVTEGTPPPSPSSPNPPPEDSNPPPGPQPVANGTAHHAVVPDVAASEGKDVPPTEGTVPPPPDKAEGQPAATPVSQPPAGDPTPGTLPHSSSMEVHGDGRSESFQLPEDGEGWSFVQPQMPTAQQLQLYSSLTNEMHVKYRDFCLQQQFGERMSSAQLAAIFAPLTTWIDALLPMVNTTFLLTTYESTTNGRSTLTPTDRETLKKKTAVLLEFYISLRLLHPNLVLRCLSGSSPSPAPMTSSCSLNTSDDKIAMVILVFMQQRNLLALRDVNQEQLVTCCNSLGMASDNYLALSFLLDSILPSPRLPLPRGYLPHPSGASHSHHVNHLWQPLLSAVRCNLTTGIDADILQHSPRAVDEVRSRPNLAVILWFLPYLFAVGTVKAQNLAVTLYPNLGWKNVRMATSRTVQRATHEVLDMEWDSERESLFQDMYLDYLLMLSQTHKEVGKNQSFVLQYLSVLLHTISSMPIYRIRQHALSQGTTMSDPPSVPPEERLQERKLRRLEGLVKEIVSNPQTFTYDTNEVSSLFIRLGFYDGLLMLGRNTLFIQTLLQRDQLNLLFEYFRNAGKDSESDWAFLLRTVYKMKNDLEAGVVKSDEFEEMSVAGPLHRAVYIACVSVGATKTMELISTHLGTELRYETELQDLYKKLGIIAASESPILGPADPPRY
eukprot:Sspe_Gene.80446::Locus_50808_Transcript_1_1_Confidence_1.000_Length_4283::g.80446::m.80446